MSDWNPGGGWREIGVAEISRIGEPAVTWHDGRTKRTWVRHESVPPLPTEPWTVIRAVWREGAYPMADDQLMLNDERLWADSQCGGITAEDLAGRITGFKVLAEPTPRVALYQEQQRVARDVLEAVRDDVILPGEYTPEMQALAAKYGIELGEYGADA